MVRLIVGILAEGVVTSSGGIFENGQDFAPGQLLVVAHRKKERHADGERSYP
ncbi:MAG: hypothetical protein K9G33_04080 [Sneathiella sp.]|nr:hypothetical protein [Sneathiella sp.]